jgi:glucosamine kinase
VSYYLGIDGGGTKTASAVGDETSLLATATSGPSNVVRVGEPQAREALHQSIRNVCTAAGITPTQIAHTCIGAAGAARPEVVAILRRALSEILPGPVDVVGDTHIALQSAFDDAPGVIVISGTGSIAYGRDSQGRTARAGGWGFAISDEGSAQWIGRTAISAVLRHTDSMASDQHAVNPNSDSALYSSLLKAWGIRSLDDLVRAANATPAPDFSALLPAVLQSFDTGDPLARDVLTQAGRELASLAEVVSQRLFPAVSPRDGTSPSAPLRVAMSGGVFRHASQVREVFYNEIHRQRPDAEIKPEVVDPLMGALALARRKVVP